MKGIIIVLCILFVALTAYARRGCCSWHGGVARCDAQVGRLVCRDGTFSPSCLCPKAVTSSIVTRSTIDVDTLKGFQQACVSDNAVYRAYCAGFIKSAIEAHFYMQLQSQLSHVKNNERISCVQKLAAANSGNIKLAVLKILEYFRNHPEHSAQLVGISVLKAINSIYPDVKC